MVTNPSERPLGRTPGKRKYSLDCKEDNKVMAEDEIINDQLS